MSTPVSDAGAPAPRSSRKNVFFEEDAPPEKFCPTCETRHPHDFKMCPADGTALVEADELVGTTLSDTYVVTRIMGEGGMGRVYEARHNRIASKRFAIKTLHPELSSVPQLLARFQREANAAAAIDSPHVVGVFDIDEGADGRPFLVSELLEGIELAEHIESMGRLPIAFAVHIVRQLCKALAAAHAVGAVHRDLKPENVFLTGVASSPIAKVLDFGIAKFDDQASLTKTGMIMGTPSFMAREQALGERVDHRCDIYALGAILYCALTGRAPHEGDDPAAVVVSVLTQDPPRPRELEPNIPEMLELVIERAMASDRDQRFETAAELDMALAPFDVSDEALAASSSGLATTLRSAPSLNRRIDVADGELAEQTSRETVLFGALGAGWLALSLFNALAALVALKAEEPPGVLVSVLLGVVSLLLVGVPGTLLARRIRDTLWPDQSRRLELAVAVRAPVIAGGVVFGLGALLLRFAELVLVRASGAAWPGWDLILFVSSLLVAGVTTMMGQRQRAGRSVAISPVVLAAVGLLVFVLLFVALPLLRA